MRIPFGLFTIIVFVVGIGSTSAQFNIPQSISLCHRNSKFTQCVKDLIHTMRPFLQSGDLGDNVVISQFDPVSLDDIFINRGPDFKITLTNIIVRNARSYFIDKFKFDFKKNVIDLLLTFDAMDFRSDYDLDLRLSLLRIVGQGKLNATLESGKSRVRMQGSFYEKDGQQYFKVDSCGVKMKFTGVPIYLENLFNGNKELSDTGNQALNENIDLLLVDIIPAVENSLAKKFKYSANVIFGIAPFELLVPK